MSLVLRESRSRIAEGIAVSMTGMTSRTSRGGRLVIQVLTEMSGGNRSSGSCRLSCLGVLCWLLFCLMSVSVRLSSGVLRGMSSIWVLV